MWVGKAVLIKNHHFKRFNVIQNFALPSFRPTYGPTYGPTYRLSSFANGVVDCQRRSDKGKNK